MMHLFGIGQTTSPILQTMRQRVVATHIYKAFLQQSANRDLHPLCCIKLQIGKFLLSAAICIKFFFFVILELSL